VIIVQDNSFDATAAEAITSGEDIELPARAFAVPSGPSCTHRA
jgi:hypothetical protein